MTFQLMMNSLIAAQDDLYFTDLPQRDIIHQISMKFHINVFPMIQQKISQHGFKLGAERATNDGAGYFQLRHQVSMSCVCYCRGARLKKRIDYILYKTDAGTPSNPRPP